MSGIENKDVVNEVKGVLSCGAVSSPYTVSVFYGSQTGTAKVTLTCIYMCIVCTCMLHCTTMYMYLDTSD